MNLKPLTSKWRLALVLAGISALMTACHRLPPPTGGTAAVQGKPVPLAANSGAAPDTNAFAAAELAHAKYVHETIERLVSLQMNDDPASLAAILAEMKNSDKAIRDAALKATIQFNDRSAIPALQKIADETTDPYEKVDILKAIDYLKLPSFTEYMAYRRSLKAAGQPTNAPADAPMSATNPTPAAVQP